MMFDRVGDGGIPPLPTTMVVTPVEELSYSLPLAPDTDNDSITVSEKATLFTNNTKDPLVDCVEEIVIDVGNVVTNRDETIVPF